MIPLLFILCFNPGERLEYEAKWAFLSLGTMTLEIIDTVDYDGFNCYHISSLLASNPRLIILDEPVSALDVSIRAQIMNLLHDIQQDLGITYLLIAHNLAVVKHMSKTIGVMYLGKLVEVAESEELYHHPLHPYTQALLSSAMPSHPDEHRQEIVLPGEVSTPFNPPPGCRLYRRCFSARPVCSEEEPPLKEVSSGHFVSCHLY